MHTIIFQITSKFLLVLMLIFSFWALFRGHNAPGGGFVAGLITSSAFALYLMAFGKRRLRKILPVRFSVLLCGGLLLVLTSGLMGWFRGMPFLTGSWCCPFMDVFLGSPLLFDVGVYLVITASILMLLVALEGDCS